MNKEDLIQKFKKYVKLYDMSDYEDISRDVEDCFYSKQSISYTINKNNSDKILLDLDLKE